MPFSRRRDEKSLQSRHWTSIPPRQRLVNKFLGNHVSNYSRTSSSCLAEGWGGEVPQIQYRTTKNTRNTPFTFLMALLKIKSEYFYLRVDH
jgi:hypothetical protein